MHERFIGNKLCYVVEMKWEIRRGDFLMYRERRKEAANEIC